MDIGAHIKSVANNSPAWRVGLRPGYEILSVEGEHLRDVLDWMWLTDGDSVEIEYLDDAGAFKKVKLAREFGEEWGLLFTESIFDGVKTCKNACTFCFMRQLPDNMRSTLTVRDDDFRMSFLAGNFVTLTNLTETDIERIIEQHISPLRMSLHAINPEVRKSLMGENAQAGIDNLEVLLDAGICFDAQIVLVPGVNDGAVLTETLKWALSHDGIENIAVVPLGYTKYQDRFDRSFETITSALDVINTIGKIQDVALLDRGYPFAYAADEFYRNAYRDELLKHLPPAEFYNGYAMFEDGVGIIRYAVDSFHEAEHKGVCKRLAQVLAARNTCVFWICGEAMTPQVSLLLEESELKDSVLPLIVANDFFGGNVNVTGLLCGCDIMTAIQGALDEANKSSVRDFPYEPFDISSGIPCGIPGNLRPVFVLPDVLFNDDGLTLDDMSLDDIRHLTGACVYKVPSDPLDCFLTLIEILED